MQTDRKETQWRLRAISWSIFRLQNSSSNSEHDLEECGLTDIRNGFFSFTGEFPDSHGDFTIYIGFPDFEEGLAEWDDFSFVLVLDDDFGRPYTPFYGKNYKKDIQDFPCLEFVIEKYNEFMDSFDFLCEDLA